MERPWRSFAVFGLACGLLSACGGGGGSGGNVSVTGRLVGDGVPKAAVGAAPTRRARTVVNSSFSTLRDLHVTGRFDDIVAGDILMVESSVSNDTGATLDVVITTVAEDAAFVTPEVWSCLKCYPHSDGGGESCIYLWDVEGGTLLAPVPAPALPVCDSSVADTSGPCVDTFDGVDCAHPSWRVEYESPGDGLWRAESYASIAPGETWRGSVGYGHSAMDVRSDHYARWTVTDQAGNVLDQKDYAFDVVP